MNLFSQAIICPNALVVYLYFYYSISIEVSEDEADDSSIGSDDDYEPSINITLGWANDVCNLWSIQRNFRRKPKNIYASFPYFRDNHGVSCRYSSLSTTCVSMLQQTIAVLSKMNFIYDPAPEERVIITYIGEQKRLRAMKYRSSERFGQRALLVVLLGTVHA